MNEEQQEAYRKRIYSRTKEMYQEYLSQKLDLIFNSEVGEESRNLIRGKVLNEMITNIPNPGEYYFIDDEFEEGYIRVRDYMGRYDFMDRYGIPMVGEIGVIDYKGDRVCGILCNELHKFSEGKALVKSDREGCYFMTDGRGKFGSFDDARDFHEGYAAVKKDGKWNFVSHDRKFLLAEWVDEVSDIHLGRARIRKGLQVKTIYVHLKDYQIRLTIGGYQLLKEKTKIRIKYHPVIVFNDDAILCTDNRYYYFYDRANNKYEKLGLVTDIYYDDNFIYDKKNKIVYLVYNNMLLDITEYYKTHLVGKNKVSIDKHIGEILSLDEFSFVNMEARNKMMDEEREKNKKIIKNQKEEKKRKDLEEKLEEEKRKEEETKQKRIEGLRKLREGLELIRSSSKGDSFTRVRYDIDFIEVDDHLEIPEILLDFLKYIELSLNDFTNVKLSGIDFRGCDIDGINLQVIYHKDLSNCNFEGVIIGNRLNFTGVDIRGSKFTYDDRKLTLNTINETIKDAIYDDTTTITVFDNTGVRTIPLIDFINRKTK